MAFTREPSGSLASTYKEAKIRHWWGRLPGSALRPRLLERLYPYVFRDHSRGRHFLREFFAVDPRQLDDPFFSHAVRWGGGARNLPFLSKGCRERLDGYDPREELLRLLPDGFAGRDLLSRAQFLEIELFLAGFLLSSQGDRVAMAHSVEMRHPFLDYRVIESAFRLPPHWKMRGLAEKYFLKKACRNLLPEGILKRAKQPYRAPVRSLFTLAAPDYVEELLSGASLRASGYFDPARVGRLLRKVLAAPAGEFDHMALMGIVTTEILHRQFVAAASWKGVPVVRPDLVCGPLRKKVGRPRG